MRSGGEGVGGKGVGGRGGWLEVVGGRETGQETMQKEGGKRTREQGRCRFVCVCEREGVEGIHCLIPGHPYLGYFGN